MSRLSVIVVSYNTVGPLRRCLESLRGTGDVIVVDNASTDGSAEMVAREFPGVKLLSNTVNRGFGAANNQGLDAMTGDLALLLNSDAVAHDGAVARLVEVMDSDKQIVACGGRLLNPDRSTQWSCGSELTLWAVFCEQTFLERLFQRSRFFSPYWQTSRLLEKSETVPHDVAQVMGACLMMRPVERFDERFFLYCEDTELCRRLTKHGRIVYVPDAFFTHELGSSSQQRWKAVARYNRGKELYFLIHHGSLKAAIALFWNRIGALKRVVLFGLLTVLTLFVFRCFRDKAAMFLRVLTAPVAGPAKN